MGNLKLFHARRDDETSRRSNGWFSFGERRKYIVLYKVPSTPSTKYSIAWKSSRFFGV